MKRFLLAVCTLLPLVGETQVPQETHQPPANASWQNGLAWGDDNLHLALEGNTLVAREDAQSSPVMSWSPSTSFLAWARTDRVEQEQRTWVDAKRRAIALIDGDDLEVRWLAGQGEELVQTLRLPTTGYSRAEVVWPKECELPVLQLSYSGGKVVVLTAATGQQLQEVHRFEGVATLSDVLTYSPDIAAGAVTVEPPAASTWVWWHRCTDVEQRSGNIALKYPMMQPEVAAGTRILMVFDLLPYGGAFEALYRVDTHTSVLEQLTPCPEGAWPVEVLGQPDDRPVRLRCWTGGNSSSAYIDVSQE
jgi:hypothetical protein